MSFVVYPGFLIAAYAVSRLSYAEWLLSSSDDKEAAEDVLLAAADALLEFDTGDRKWGV